MKFNVSTDELAARLSVISRVLPAKKTFGILDSFLFDLEGDSLELTASDGDRSMVTRMTVNDVEEGGKIAIPKLILDACKALPGATMTINIDLESRAITMTNGGWSADLNGDDANSYPTPKDGDESTQEFRIQASDLMYAIDHTQFAAGTDRYRQTLCGIFIEASPEVVSFVATDTMKLSHVRTKEATCSDTFHFILPTELSKLLKMCLGSGEDVVVSLTGSSVKIETNDYTLRGLLIEGEYPNYRKAIPNESEFEVIADRKGVLEVIKHVTPFAESADSALNFTVSDRTLTIGAISMEYSGKRAIEKIECSTDDGVEISVGMKCGDLTDVLSGFDSDSFVVKTATATRGIVVEPVYSTVAEGEEDKSVQGMRFEQKCVLIPFQPSTY